MNAKAMLTIHATLEAKKKERIERARTEMKPEVERLISRYIAPGFKADVWGTVKIECAKADDYVELIVAGFDKKKERRIFIATVSLTHLLAPYVIRVEEAKTVYTG